MVDEEDKGFPLLGREMQAGGDALRKDGACFRVGPRPYCFTGIVQQERQIKNERILQRLKQFAIRNELWFFHARESIQLIDAYQRVLVRRVAMKKLMLNKTR